MRKIYTGRNPGDSVHSAIDEVYSSSSLFRGPLNHTMRIKPHYRFYGGLWRRAWCDYVYAESRLGGE